MRITGDQQLIKKINKSIVLKTIRDKSPISRAQISELTTLNKGTVSALVNELIAEDLVYEIGIGQSKGGRRPVLLDYNNVAGYAIGVNLGVNYILTILTDLQGNIVKNEMKILKETSVESILFELKTSITAMIAQAPASTKGIVGIGIGVPGIVDQDGYVLLAPNLGWTSVNLKELIFNEFNLPVTIQNEAHAGALGEQLFGIGKGFNNLIYASIGIGIGTGIIINNELFKGTSGFSGEMGHFIIEVNGKRCSCGNQGCWELYASENALLEQANSLPVFSSTAKAELDLERLIDMANSGHPDIIGLFNQIGEYIGVGLTNIINTFNPELVIIGNRMAKAEKWIKEPIDRVIKSRSLPFHRENLRVEFSHLGVYACPLGASSLAISNYFTDVKVTVD